MKKTAPICLAVFVTLYSATWFVLAGMAERRILAQLAAEKEHGVEISMARHERSGFPFGFAASFTGLKAVGQNGATFTAPSLKVESRFFHWSHVTLTAPSGAAVTLPLGKRRQAISASIVTAAGTADFDLTAVRQSDLTLNAVTVAGLVTGEGPLSAARINLHVDQPASPPSDHTQPGAHVTLDVDEVLLPPPPLPALGNSIKGVTLEATVMGKVPVLSEASLSAWRDDGGTVEVKELSLDWGPLGLGLGGTLSLDDGLQPSGAFSARMTGYAETLQALAQTGAVSGGTARTATMGLGMIARPNEAGVSTLSVPLTIQNRAVYLSPLKVATLPEIRLY